MNRKYTIEIQVGDRRLGHHFEFDIDRPHYPGSTDEDNFEWAKNRAWHLLDMLGLRAWNDLAGSDRDPSWFTFEGSWQCRARIRDDDRPVLLVVKDITFRRYKAELPGGVTMYDQGNGLMIEDVSKRVRQMLYNCGLNVGTGGPVGRDAESQDALDCDWIVWYGEQSADTHNYYVAIWDITNG